jgi:hemoglobin
MNKQDIQNIEDIKLLVNHFYDEVKKDEMLCDIFNSIIQDRWPEHLEKMYRFWQTVLLNEHTYYGSPFGPHANLPVSKMHFDRWITLFNQTIDNLFSGTKAEQAKWQGNRMATIFQSKIEYYKKTM